MTDFNLKKFLVEQQILRVSELARIAKEKYLEDFDPEKLAEIHEVSERQTQKMIDMTKADGVAIKSMIKEKPTCINTSGL